jgi:signal peptidase II
MLKTVRTFSLLAIVITTIGCDRVTKQLAAIHLAGAADRHYLAGTIRLEYAENTGGFLSMGATLPRWVRITIFTFGTAVILGILATFVWQEQRDDPMVLGLCLTLAGGMSNLLDRVVRGSVIDFLNVGLGPIRSGIFNVADVAVMIGLILIAVTSIRSRGHQIQV